jgi:CubicO group peptidase (beta-lactamase class C family)
LVARRRYAALLSIPTLAVGCAECDDTHRGVEVGADNAAIDAVFAPWDQPRSPGCALGVARDGDLFYSRGYGYANLDHDIPITPQTVFDVGSVTKQFTAASLSMLALAGKLTLDDDVRKWLPELPEYEWPITLRHMLHHTSGLRDYLNLFPLAGRDDYHPISHAQILAMMSRQRALIFPPGDRYLYSNTAYMLLAQVVERAGDKSLGEMAQERIFEPLEMEGSFMYEDLTAIIPRRATGYDRDAEGRLRIAHNYNFDVAGDGQLYSTVEDLLRWDDYLHGAEEPAIHSVMLTEGRLNAGDPIGYAQGIRLSEHRGLRTVGHSGSSWGFRTELVRFVEPRLSIAISCNTGSADPESLARRVADHYLTDALEPESRDAAPGAEPPVAGAASSRPALTIDRLAEFTGSFFAPELDAIYRFSVVEGGLVVGIEQEPPLQLAVVADDRFEFSFHPKGWSEPQPVSLEFHRDRSGAITGFGLSAGSERGIVFVRHQSR